MTKKRQSDTTQMIIGSINETTDKRVAVTPTTVKKLTQRGFEVRLEQGFGTHLFTDSAYKAAGAYMVSQNTVLESNTLVQVALLQQVKIRELLA